MNGLHSTLLVRTRSSFRDADLTTLLGAVTVLAMLLPANPASAFVTVVGLCTLSGASVTFLLRLGRARVLQRALVCLASGFLTFLLMGAVIGAALPRLGDDRPLGRTTELLMWCVVALSISTWSMLSRTDPVRQLLSGVRGSDFAWLGALCLPPCIALIGVVRLNVSSSPAISTLTAILAIAMTIGAIVPKRSAKAPPRGLLLASAVLTLAWQGPLRGGWLAGFDTQHEYYVGKLAIAQAVFPLQHYSDPYGGMLSLTVWPVQLLSLASINLRTTLAIAPGIFLALMLLCVWSALGEWCSSRLSTLLCALFVVGCAPLVQELPEVTRQCYALFFFALLVMAVASKELHVAARRWIVVGSGIGLAVCHYSSAYLAAGAVLVGFLATLVSRQPKELRVLNLPVSALVIGAATLWGAFVAKTGHNISQVLTAIRNDGFNLLPGTGSVITRWLNASGTGQLVNAEVIRQADLHLRATSYRWMAVDSAAAKVPLVNDPAPTAHGVPVLGSVIGIASSVLSEGVLALAVVCVFVFLWRLRRDSGFAPLAGMGMGFVVISAISRLSQTIGVDFSPARIEVQAYLLFAVVAGVAVQRSVLGEWLVAVTKVVDRWMYPVLIAGFLAGFAVFMSSELGNLLEPGAQLPVNLSATGEAAQHLISPQDIEAAQWLNSNRPAKEVVQADRFGQLALDDFGYNVRPDFVPSVDPIIVDNFAWILAYRANVLNGTARGGNNARIGVFRFPSTYFARTRTILYVSPTDMIFGRVPVGSVPLSGSALTYTATLTGH